MTDYETQVATLSSELRAADEQRRRLESEVAQLRQGVAPIDHIGAEVAAVLRSFAETVEAAKRDAEHRAAQTLAEAHATASDIRQAAEEDAHRLRLAAQDALDQGLQGLDVARAEARVMWEEARTNADTMLNDASAEAARLMEEARAAAQQTQSDAEGLAARTLSDAHMLADVQASNAATRVQQIFESARVELRRLHEARVDALRALETSEQRMREIADTLRSLGDLNEELLTLASAEPSTVVPVAQLEPAPPPPPVNLSELPPPPPMPPPPDIPAPPPLVWPADEGAADDID